MHPILLQFQVFGHDFTFGTYGLMAVTGIFTAIFITYLLGRRFAYPPDDVLNCALLTAVGGIAGAFTIGFILFLPERISYGFFRYPPALVSWGGILGGLIVISFMKLKWSLNLLNFADIVAPGFFVGLGIGRIGCHFAGCCFGIATSQWYGITFNHPMAPASMMQQPLMPVQLISAASLIAIGLAMIPFALRRKIPGTFLAAMLILYPLFRFNIEFIRADSRSFFMGLSDGQLYSIWSFLLGMFCAAYVYRHRHSLREKLLIFYEKNNRVPGQ